MRRNGSRGQRAPMFHRSQTTATRISVGTTPSTAYDPSDAGRHASKLENCRSHARFAWRREYDPKSFSLDGRPVAQARQWLDEQVSARGLDAHALDAPSPYEMPAHAVAYGATYDVEHSADALVELAAWFANAEAVLAH